MYNNDMVNKDQSKHIHVYIIKLLEYWKYKSCFHKKVGKIL